MRAASRALKMFSKFLGLEISVPCWTAGRLWLLRIGLYKLRRPKEIADDWIWIIDHTVQLGNVKCMVVLGIRRKNLPKGELYLAHRDVEPIDLIPVEKSNGEIVFSQLEKNIAKTGIPAQIVSDHGTDIKCGVEMFCEKYNTVHTYDMKHKGAAVLKRELKDDEQWQKFANEASRSGKKVQQTKLSYMAPPNQRSKARYMNVKELVDWGADVLCRLQLEKEQKAEEFEKGEMYAKFGWIYAFENNLKNWKSLIDIVRTANEFIDFMGLFKGVEEYLEAELSEMPETKKLRHIANELVEFVSEQQKKIGDEGTLLGSSEIIESVIGKYKRLQNDQVKGGFTGMVLGLAASVSDFSLETVRIAIESTSTKSVWRWIKEKVGKSVYSERREFRKIARNQEQKQAEFLCTV